MTAEIIRAVLGGTVSILAGLLILNAVLKTAFVKEEKEESNGQLL